MCIRDRACSKRAADAIVGSSCTDEFVEYLLISAPPICYEEWFELLLTYDISDKIKSRMISELENLSYGEKLEYSYYLEALKDLSLIHIYIIYSKYIYQEGYLYGRIY